MKYIECTKLHVAEDTPKGFRAVFVNTYTGVGGKPDVWHTVNVQGKVPEGTKAVHLTGILIITHGSKSEIADMGLHFRTNRNRDPSKIAQCVETSTAGGQRSPMACWVSLDDNYEFQYKYTITKANSTWPTSSSYGVNLSIDACAS